MTTHDRRSFIRLALGTTALAAMPRSATAQIPETPTLGLSGDLNGDGQVDALDMTLLQNQLVSPVGTFPETPIAATAAGPIAAVQLELLLPTGQQITSQNADSIRVGRVSRGLSFRAPYMDSLPPEVRPTILQLTRAYFPHAFRAEWHANHAAFFVTVLAGTKPEWPCGYNFTVNGQWPFQIVGGQKFGVAADRFVPATGDQIDWIITV